MWFCNCLCRSQHLMMHMPDVYISSKRVHIKSLKENCQIAIYGKCRTCVEVLHQRPQDARNDTGEVLLLVCCIPLLPHSQYLATTHGRKNAELLINTQYWAIKAEFSYQLVYSLPVHYDTGLPSCLFKHSCMTSAAAVQTAGK